MLDRLNTLILIFSFTSAACLLAVIQAFRDVSKGNRIGGWIIAIFITGVVSIGFLLGLLYAFASRFH